MSTPAIDDGGPAFPFGQISETTGQPINGYFAPGMTLRDWFATHATEMDIYEHRNYQLCPQTKCVLSGRTRESARYAYADSMLRARKGGADGDR